jgi:chemotaxis signal transduction protein
MATLLRSRRFADRAIEPTQQYITFQLRQYTFALPIDRLKRVSQFKGEADPVADLSAAVNAQEDVRWIDVDQHLFSAVNPPTLGGAAIANPRQAVCVILFSDAIGDTVGLAIDTQPKMQRVARSQIFPLLEDKTDLPLFRSVCVSRIQMQEENAIFLLDLEKLCNLPVLLP